MTVPAAIAVTTPALFTVATAVLLLVHVPPEDGESVVLSPIHITVEPVKDTVGLGFTVTVLVAVAVHPLAAVTVTVYVVVLAGLTVMEAVVAAVFHK